MTERRPIGFANYPGDHTHLAGRDEPMGPNYMGELMWPVTAERDPKTDRTKVGFSLIPAQDYDTTEEP
jgi:hypothetical protein